MRITPGMGPGAIKRSRWEDLAGKYLNHDHDRQMKNDQREVWEEMISQELATGKTCFQVGQEFNRCTSTISRINRGRS